MRDNAKETLMTGKAQAEVGEDSSVRILFFFIIKFQPELNKKERVIEIKKSLLC